jgi:APA family basic amino acid/polyamine antiporter
MATAPTEAAPGADPPLKRAISRNMLLLFVVGDVVGGGIYTLVGKVGAEVGGLVWLPMGVALALALLTATAYAELVTKYPQAAGAALYVNKAFRRPFFTFMVAFAVMCSGIASAATLARGVAGTYLPQLIDGIDSTAAIKLIGVGFLLIVAAINFRGIAESVKINVVLTLIELGGLILIIVVALAALLDGTGDIGNAFSTRGEDVSLLPATITATALAFYALIGFEDSVNVAEEAKDPRRDYPRALFGGIAVAGVVYLVIGVLAPAVLPEKQLLSTDDVDNPLIYLAQTGPLGISATVFAVIGVLALANGALINMIMASRLTYGMARQGIIPSLFAGVHRTRRTPLAAIAFTTVLAIVLLIVTNDLTDLSNTTTSLLLGVFFFVNVCVLVLRRDPVGHDHFVAPSILPAIGAVVSLGLLVYRIVNDTSQIVFAGGLLLLGVVFWFISAATKQRTDQEFDTGLIEKIENPDLDDDDRR